MFSPRLQSSEWVYLFFASLCKRILINKLIVPLLVLVSLQFGYAQTCDDYWVSTLPAEGRNSKPVIDNAGFLYQVGVIPLDRAKVQGITVAKYTQSGDIVWSRSFSGIFWAFRLKAVVIGGNLFVGGSYRNADFQDGSGTIFSTDNEFDPFILKMDTASNVISVQIFPGSGFDEFLGFTNDSEGNLYFSGQFREILVLPNNDTLGINASTNFDSTWGPLIKMDTNFNVIWVKMPNLTSAGGGQISRGFEIVVDALDNIYMGGHFNYELTFGDGPTFTSGFVSWNPFVAKFDKLGNTQWIMGTSALDNATVYALAVDGMQNIFYAGTIFGSSLTVGGVDYISNGSGDAFVGKIDIAGNPIWFNPVGTTGGNFEWAGSVDLDANGFLYLASSADTQTDGVVIFDAESNSVDFGTDFTTTSYIAKYNMETGSLISAHKALYQDNTVIGRGGLIIGNYFFRSGRPAFLVRELLSGIEIDSFRLPQIIIDGFASILVGDSVKLMAKAPNAVSYQWFLDDVAIPGATDSVFYAKNQGKYDLEIENSFGCTLTSLPGLPINITTLQPGNVYTVNSTGDLGDFNKGDGICLDGLGNCTLRAAIEEANTSAGTVDTIKFNISGAGPHTIQPNSGLPTIADPVIIDGTSEPDFAGTPIVELDGSFAGLNAIGLHITAERSILRGLVINRFGGSGVFINGVSAIGNMVQGNFIGTDVTGTLPLGNLGFGVQICCGAHENIIGGASEVERNLISGNNSSGIWIRNPGTDRNKISGNYIGTDITGTVPLGNIGRGVRIGEGAKFNCVGTDGDGLADSTERNIISGNTRVGVVIASNAESNIVAGNFIGVDITGTVALPNAFDGINLGGVELSNGVKFNRIGSNGDGISDALERNIISGNAAHGVLLFSAGTEQNLIAGNYIGTDVTGTIALKNTLNGVSISSRASKNTIGGTTDAERNIISGNTSYGVLITGVGSDSNTVAGNYIGTDITGTDSIPNNQGVGIWSSAKFNVIGTNGDGVSDSLERNIISGNSLNGVEISNNAEQNIVAGNLIGTDVTGTIAIPNAHGGNAAGVGIANGPKLNLIGTNNDGVSDELERNIISGNNGSGIDIFNSGGLNIIAGNYIGTDITGTDSLGNGLNGITLFGTSEDNQILKNLIAFNNEPAIRFLGQASGNIIGGDSVENGNTIFNNAGGIVLSSTVVNNQILFNTFSNNGDLAIDLNEDGITENDSSDPDTGANNLQNYPDVSLASINTISTLTVNYLVDSDTSNSTYPLTVQLFKTDSVGQGKYLLHSGSYSFNESAEIMILNEEIEPGDKVVATATDADGNTSEFSAPFEVTAPSTETDFLSFSVPGQFGEAEINATNHTINLDVFANTPVTGLAATFTLSERAAASVGNNDQVSGTTANDFTDSVTYTVTSEDIIVTQDWTVKVSELNVTSLNDDLQGKSIKVYPNPTPNRLKFSIPYHGAFENSQLYLFNYTGQSMGVFKLKEVGENLELDLKIQHWPDGIYYYKLIGSDQSFRGKFIKQ